MEEVLSRFHHIGEEIFDLLDEESFLKCKNICKTWEKLICDPNKKLIWIRVIKWYENNAFIRSNFAGRKKIPLTSFINGPKPKWSKFKINDLKEFVNRLDSDSEINGLTLETFLEKYAELKVELNAKNEDEFQDTIFHFACCYGHSKMVNLLLTESANLSINLNARNEYGLETVKNET